MEHPFSILKCDSAHPSTASTRDPETSSILQSLAGVILTSTYTGRRNTIGNSGDRIALTSKPSSKSGQHFKVIDKMSFAKVNCDSYSQLLIILFVYI